MTKCKSRGWGWGWDGVGWDEMTMVPVPTAIQHRPTDRAEEWLQDGETRELQ